MPTIHDVRALRDQIDTRIRSLRELSESIGQPLSDVEVGFQTIGQNLPQDLAGRGAATWTELESADQLSFYNQLRSLNQKLDDIEYSSRQCTPTETWLLLAYTGLLPTLLLIPVFWCICARAVTMPERINDSEVVDRETASESEPGKTPARKSAKKKAQGNDAAANSAMSNPKESTEPAHPAYVFLLIFCVGAIGGSLRTMGSAVYYFGIQKFYRSWLPYYYFAPLESALLAFLVCLVVLSGFVNPEEYLGNGADTKSTLFLYAIAAFTGLFVKNMLRKLKDVTDAVFGVASPTDAA